MIYGWWLFGFDMRLLFLLMRLLSLLGCSGKYLFAVVWGIFLCCRWLLLPSLLLFLTSVCLLSCLFVCIYFCLLLYLLLLLLLFVTCVVVNIISSCLCKCLNFDVFGLPVFVVAVVVVVFAVLYCDLLMFAVVSHDLFLCCSCIFCLCCFDLFWC